MLARVGLLVLLCLGCGGGSRERVGPAAAHPTADSAPPPTTAPVVAHARLIHAAIEARDSAVSIVADGEPFIARTGFQFASAYGELAPGPHALSAQSDGQELIGASMTFDEGSHTLVAYSTADFPVALTRAPDAAVAGVPDAAAVRFFHAIVGTGSIDACIAPDTGHGDGQLLFAGVEAGSFGDAGGGYVQAPAGTPLLVQLRAHDATACHGHVLGGASFTPAVGNNYTLIAVGRTRGRRAPLELIFCADPPASDTSCATLVLSTH